MLHEHDTMLESNRTPNMVAHLNHGEIESIVDTRLPICGLLLDDRYCESRITSHQKPTIQFNQFIE